MSKGKTAHSPQELEAFSKRLWEAMRKKGLESKADLARLLELPDMTVGRWLESKYMPSLRHMKMLADKLNVTVDYLQGSEPMARSCIIFNDDPLAEEVQKTISVLRSPTHFSDSLRANIESFHRGVKKEIEFDELKRMFIEMSEKLKNMESFMANFQKRSASITAPKLKPSKREESNNQDT